MGEFYKLLFPYLQGAFLLKFTYSIEIFYSHRKVVHEALPACGTFQEVVNLALECRFSGTTMFL